MENKKIINSEEIKHYIQQEKIQYIKVGITDVDGVLRGKYMHSDKLTRFVLSLPNSRINSW